jgi:hypothetical protein
MEHNMIYFKVTKIKAMPEYTHTPDIALLISYFTSRRITFLTVTE